MKLQYADINYGEIPLACSDDHVERHEIINTALERARKYYHQYSYNTVAYVGDRLWDYKASQQLAIKFIGVGPEFHSANFNSIPKINDYLTCDFMDHLNVFDFKN